MMNRKYNLIATAATAAVGLLISGNLLRAAPIVYGTGFEQPGFVAGQNVPSTPPPTLNGWFRQDGTPTATALPNVDITNVTASTGAQSLRVLNNTPFDQADDGSVTYVISPIAAFAGAADMIANGTPFVHIEWDMRIDDGTDIDDTSDTWGLDVYDSTANIRTLSVTRSALASVAGGTPDQAVVYGTTASGAFNPVPKGAAGDSGSWATYEIDLNYITRAYTISVNGSLIGGDAMNTLADNGLDINFVVNGRGIDVAYFDNFSVSAVPEPTVLAPLGLAAVGMIARRRRRD